MFRPLRSFPQAVHNCIKRKPTTNYVVDIILRRGEEWMELYLISPTRLNYVCTPFLYCSHVCMYVDIYVHIYRYMCVELVYTR